VKSEALNAAVQYASLLMQWSLLALGGSAALMLGTDHRSPKRGWARNLYWLLLPSWSALLWSVYQGVRLHSAHIGYLASNRAEMLDQLRDHASSQEWFLIAALVTLGIWLAGYLVWWIHSPEKAH
jgi:hypothetical protein